jgi:aminoglycoside/choline kinase family phosphotransferase
MRDMADSSRHRQANDARLEQARAWLAEHFSDPGGGWQPVTGDASHRRYFRVSVKGASRILMDAPPKLEDSAPFVDIDRRLRAAGLHAPEILLADTDAGFVLLEDLGDALYRDLITQDSVQPLFDDAFRALAVMAREVPHAGLPAYDRVLYCRELGWFTGFYLGRHRGYGLDSDQQREWQAFCESLVASALAQPQVFVHKDFHSCNLLRTAGNSPGIIDFQDAVSGPLTYDFVSLVWDRYVTWPRARLERWMEQYRATVAPNIDPAAWVRWCDLMGLQRNIKIVGRFALLRYEQDKRGYLEMIPRFYGYILDVLSLYPELAAVRRWLEREPCAP